MAAILFKIQCFYSRKTVGGHFELVRTITCHPLKVYSQNLDQKCILVRLLFCELVNLDFQGQI